MIEGNLTSMSELARANNIRVVLHESPGHPDIRLRAPKLAAMIGTRAVEYHQGQRSYAAPKAGHMTAADQSDQTVENPLAKRPSTYDGRGLWRDRIFRFAAGRRRHQNRTASPVDGAVSSPSHITRRPRTKVPTGQPVTVLPS